MFIIVSNHLGYVLDIKKLLSFHVPSFWCLKIRRHKTPPQTKSRLRPCFVVCVFRHVFCMLCVDDGPVSYCSRVLRHENEVRGTSMPLMRLVQTKKTKLCLQTRTHVAGFREPVARCNDERRILLNTFCSRCCCAVRNSHICAESLLCRGKLCVVSYNRAANCLSGLATGLEAPLTFKC